MSSKPNPVALTACMLMNRFWAASPKLQPRSHWEAIAAISSDLHRLAPACKRQGVAECNGEERDGQREAIERTHIPDLRRVYRDTAIRVMEARIEANGKRLDKRVAKLSERLAPLGLKACDGGDPRGSCLWLESTDPSRPVPRNGWDDERWHIG